MAETWYNSNNDALYSLVPAEYPHLEGADLVPPAGHEESIPLSKILSGEVVLPPRDAEANYPGFPWSDDKVVEYGKWILEQLQLADPEAELRLYHLRRVRRLGLPSFDQIKRTSSYTTLRFYNAALSQEAPPPPSELPLSRSDLISLINQLASQTNRRPSQAELTTYWHDLGYNEAAITASIANAAADYKQLLAMSGFPDIEAMSAGACIRYGHRIIESNGHSLTVLSSSTLEQLADKDRGPYPDEITAKLGVATIEDYLERVQKTYPAYWKFSQRSRSLRAQHLSEYRHQLTLHRLPPEFNNLSDDDLLATVSSYRLARAVLADGPRAQGHAGVVLAQLRGSREYIELLCRLSEGRIKNFEQLRKKAAEYKLAQDIWPLSMVHMQYGFLKVGHSSSWIRS